jgi:hypothetical protein
MHAARKMQKLKMRGRMDKRVSSPAVAQGAPAVHVYPCVYTRGRAVDR